MVDDVLRCYATGRTRFRGGFSCSLSGNGMLHRTWRLGSLRILVSWVTFLFCLSIVLVTFGIGGCSWLAGPKLIQNTRKLPRHLTVKTQLGPTWSRFFRNTTKLRPPQQLPPPKCVWNNYRNDSSINIQTSGISMPLELWKYRT